MGNQIIEGDVPAMSDRDLLLSIYRDVRDLRAHLQKLEADAKALSSPEALMELAQKFLGSGGFPG